MQFMGIKIQEDSPRKPLWKHQASRKRLLVNKWVRVDLFSPTYFLRDVIVLTKKDDVHKHEAAEERWAYHHQNLPTSQSYHDEIEGGGGRQITFNPGVMPSLHSLQNATQSPKIIDPIKNRKKREPEEPGTIDDNSLVQFEGARNKRLGCRV